MLFSVCFTDKIKKEPAQEVNRLNYQGEVLKVNYFLTRFLSFLPRKAHPPIARAAITPGRG